MYAFHAMYQFYRNLLDFGVSILLNIVKSLFSTDIPTSTIKYIATCSSYRN